MKKSIVCAVSMIMGAVLLLASCGEAEEVAEHSCFDYLEKRDAVASTCTTQGHKMYFECTVCGKLYSDAAACYPIEADSVLLPYSSHTLEFYNETVNEYSDFYRCVYCNRYFADENAQTEILSSEIEPYGRLIAYDTYAWIDYPASEYTLEFTAEEEAVTYEYDATKLELDLENKTVKALEEGVHKVTVTSAHHEKSFNVICHTVEKSASDTRWQPYNASQAEYFASQYKLSGHDGKTTLFIGDSFFDKSYFWTDFALTFKGKDAICAGISSTTTYDWENYMLNRTFLTGIAPKNIVMDMGTNNFYDDHDIKDVTVENLQRMFTLMHSLMPDTEIYYFSIAQRTDRSYKTEVSETNAAMNEWCQYKSWITFIDVESQMTAENLRVDGIHPTLDAYKTVYLRELESAGCEIE